MPDILLGSLPVLGRTLLAGVLAYAGMLLLLRVSGKRTLSKWNAFDFVVTVALGSSLANVILNKDITLAQGMTAFAVLIFLQYAITWLSVRLSLVRRLAKSQPTLLLYEGAICEVLLRQQRVTRSELQAALRQSGMADIAQAGAVVLETDGSFSVIPRWDVSKPWALQGVRGLPESAISDP
jgi:uncharacterized membrane protein YcaP (DUF421 family)